MGEASQALRLRDAVGLMGCRIVEVVLDLAFGEQVLDLVFAGLRAAIAMTAPFIDVGRTTLRLQVGTGINEPTLYSGSG